MKTPIPASAGKHILITGANRGLGLALTRLYLDAGWQVTACCRHPDSATELGALLEAYEALEIFELDVTVQESIDALAETFAGEPLDLLLNNAGIYGPNGLRFGTTDVDAWQRVLAVNSIAPLKLAEAFHPQLKLAGKAIIANISSKMGSMTDNTSGGAYLYRSSKAALNAVSRSMAIDLAADGISVVALHPGWVRTDMGGPQGLIDTEESTRGLKALLDKLTPDQSGGFFDYRGNAVPW
ncbi:SDR family oxidoreductase [Shewanella salipaludis]|uniref:SDR family oxidoreductase n=1 Tax=Shewanella salipaludis TaxID=2723052 RepID=A0A972JHI7_9GAMM|nr:SDR family oxidoreductase [Shewanella salipaludis]NMH64043.1 SDR family oxidoreductase [Shewanella salipaludis]